MGNCCRPEEEEDKRGQVEMPAASRPREADRGSSLKPENAEVVREKYRRWMEDKEAVASKN